MNWLQSLVQAASALSIMLKTVGDIADAVEQEIPRGGGDIKNKALVDTVSHVLDAADAMASDGEALSPGTRQAVLKLASGTADVVVGLRNASRKYQKLGPASD